MIAFQMGTDSIILGAINGLTYAALAAGLVLIYRATRVVNFAHGEIGAFSASVLALLVLEWHWNYWAALIAAVAAAAAAGALVERLVIHRLFDAPRVIVLVATIGVSQLLLFAQVALPKISPRNVGLYPTPFKAKVTVAGAVLTGDRLFVIVLVPLILVLLGVFLTKSRYGTAIRAAADNPDAARLAGIRVRRVSTAVWTLGGLLAGLTFVLIAPVRNFTPGVVTQTLGPGLLLRALACALVGRMVSLPLALVGGIAVGVGEALILLNSPRPGVADFWVFVAVLALVLFRGASTQADDGGLGSFVPTIRAASHRLSRSVSRYTAFAAIGIAIALPLVFTTSSSQLTLTRMLLYALVGISLTIVTGWGGQISLCQFAFAGLGGVATGALCHNGVPFGVAVVDGAIIGALAALVVAAPAVRIRGLFLAVTTLAFAIGAQGYLLVLGTFDHGKGLVPRGTLGPIDLSSERNYYFVCLAVLIAVTIGVTHLRKTGIGRRILAVRENENGASAFSVSPTQTKLAGFGLSGAIAGLAGGLLIGLTVIYDAGSFSATESLRVLGMVVIGGVGSVAGAIAGAVYLIGLPVLLGDSLGAQLLVSGVGMLVLLLVLPGGLTEAASRVRDRVLRRWATASPRGGDTETPAATWGGGSLRVRPSTDRNGHEPATAMRVSDLVVKFGGLTAVNGASLQVNHGEIVGLIGTNGAGKSTLLDAVGGYTQSRGGQIEVFEGDVTHLPPHARAALGVGRVFQTARLFPALTVLDTVKVALEARTRTELFPSVFAFPPSVREERAKSATAGEIVDFLGLGSFANLRISALSTGTRRICELACLFAVDARLLLLDEPTAGVAQRDAEAFGPLVKRLRDELEASVLLVEHDMPLVMSISDRIYCMSAGEVIAEGPPSVVRRDPDVIAAYLGADERAINRSGALQKATR